MKVKIYNLYNLQNSKNVITSIPEVEETEINNCVQIIMTENRNIPIQNIYYSKSIKTLDFEADRSLSFKGWLRYRFKKEKNYLLNQKDIHNDHYLRLYDSNFKYTHKMREVEDFINLYDLKQIMLSTNEEVNYLLNSFNEILREKYGDVKISDFNTVCLLTIAHQEYKYRLPVRIGNKMLYLSKDKDNSLVNVNEYSMGLLNTNDELRTDLSYMYDRLSKYFSFFFEDEYSKRLINSKLAADITPWHISIGLEHTDFLKLKFNRFNEYEFIGDGILQSYSIDEDIAYLANEEDLIFKKAFIRIGNCPIYFKKVIYDIVNEKLEQQNKENLVRKLKQ